MPERIRFRITALPNILQASRRLPREIAVGIRIATPTPVSVPTVPKRET